MAYLLKASAITIIFYGCYKLFLQRETFFEQNRWFLLLGLTSTFIFPFLIIPIYVDQEPFIVPHFTFNEDANFENITKEGFIFFNYLPILYGIGVIIFSIRFIIQLASLFNIITKKSIKQPDGFRFIETTNNALPFSFFKWIVYNPSQFKTTELNHIITHEKTHANQYHSIDALLTQVSSIILWFNPIIWLYSKELKQNLEFIADKQTQKNIDCKKSYQYTLLKTSIPANQLVITNNFYNSLIKKRIVMLHKSKSKKVNYLKYLLILPILGWFLMSFNTKEIIIKKSNIKNSITSNNANYGDKLNVYIEKNMTDHMLNQIKADLNKKGYNLSINGVKRNTNNDITSIKIKVSYKNSHNTSFSSNSKKPLKTIKIAIDKKDHSISIGNSESHAFKFAPAIINAQMQTGKKPIYVVDGKIITNEGFTLHKYDIKSVNVLKGKNAIDKYGNKAKDGAIEITNKNKTSVSIKTVKQKIPLYILDGKEITEKEMKAISSENIEKINVLKGERAIKKYGVKGENGVVEITLKQKN
ncbi:hypothetical protein GCM10022291_00190 [Postechiella marina]|uniref:Peptidase M56 domain-containing protein n=1 Tax=Postechiella marina TaxID=943941 RepID=A0ABP8BY69_9FLAO